MRSKADAAHRQFAVKALYRVLEFRALDGQLQIAESQTQKLLVRKLFPGLGSRPRSPCNGHASSSAIASSSASVIGSTARRPSRPAKSKSLASASWEPETLQMLEKIASMRPGNFCSQSHSMFFTARRCRLACEPHSVHGMTGNARAAA